MISNYQLLGLFSNHQVKNLFHISKFCEYCIYIKGNPKYLIQGYK